MSFSPQNPNCPPAYGGCSCSCHRFPEVMHCVPCCRPTKEDLEMNLEINKINELKEENEKLKKEIERLQVFEPTLARLALENGTLDVHMKCTEILHILADLFTKWLELQKAENYTETSATINATPPKFSAKFGYDILITIQKLSKPTPHEFRVKAEQKNKELIQGLLKLERDIVENPSAAKELTQLFIAKIAML